MRLMMSDAQAGLLRAIYNLAEKAVPDLRCDPQLLVVESQSAQNWASITFSGQRHQIGLRLGGAVEVQEKVQQILEACVGSLSCRMAGHYLVDAMVTALSYEQEEGARVTRMEIEAVTLVED